MEDFARKLMTLAKEEEQEFLPSAIFGTAGQLARSIETGPSTRIGMWPIVSADHAEAAMGIGAWLALLLERWPDVVVYRLFARLEGDPEAYTHSISASQFDIDDWQVEPLDENAALWGTLIQDAGLWVLKLNLENDLEEGDDIHQFSLSEPSLAALLTNLPDVAAQIVEKLNVTRTVLEPYPAFSAPDETLQPMLRALFDWHLNLMLYLWGKSWSEKEARSNFETLISTAETLPQAVTWAVSSAAAHGIQPGYGAIADFLVSFVSQIIALLPDYPEPAVVLGAALYRYGQPDDAIELVEAATEAYADSVRTWLTLAQLYQVSGRALEAVDVYQSAIENEAVNALLYRRYGALMTALAADGRKIDEFILIDPDDYDEAFMTYEAIEAYEEALALEPDSADALQRQALLLTELMADDDLWAVFERLVEHDETGDLVREVIDGLFVLDDLVPAVNVLETAIVKNPGRVDLHLNLAALYLLMEAGEDARRILDHAETLTDDPLILSEIIRMTLYADNPDFEARFAELSGLVDAGHSPRAEDADFLEKTIESAPDFVEAYVVLAKTYINWGETDDALDTLLDGYKEAPEDPQLVECLAELLWESGQDELAFEYLNKAIEKHPNYVPLLAMTGQYLVEDEQLEAAKPYLARAEAISPRHPALSRARAEIAQILSERN